MTGLLVLGSCGENGALSATNGSRSLPAGGAGVDEPDASDGRRAGARHPEAVADARAYAQKPARTPCSCCRRSFSRIPPPSSADHFRAVAAAAPARPSCLAYNIPSRVNVALEPALMCELAGEGVMAGVKDSSGNVEAQRLLAEATADIDGFRRYTGSEFAIDGLLLGGFHGAVPGLANVFAPWHVELAARRRGGTGRVLPTCRAASSGCSGSTSIRWPAGVSARRWSVR